MGAGTAGIQMPRKREQEIMLQYFPRNPSHLSLRGKLLQEIATSTSWASLNAQTALSQPLIVSQQCEAISDICNQLQAVLRLFTINIILSKAEIILAIGI